MKSLFFVTFLLSSVTFLQCQNSITSKDCEILDVKEITNLLDEPLKYSQDLLIPCYELVEVSTKRGYTVYDFETASTSGKYAITVGREFTDENKKTLKQKYLVLGTSSAEIYDRYRKNLEDSGFKYQETNSAGELVFRKNDVRMYAYRISTPYSIYEKGFYVVDLKLEL